MNSRYTLTIETAEPPLPEQSIFNPVLEDVMRQIIQDLEDRHVNIQQTLGSIIGPVTVDLSSGTHEISFRVGE